MRVSCSIDSELSTATHALPEGMLEAHGATHLWDVVSERITEETPYLLMDMSKIKLMTSAGVGILIRILTRARNLSGAVSVYGCSDRNETILRIVGIKPLINVCSTEADSRDKLRELGAG